MQQRFQISILSAPQAIPPKRIKYPNPLLYSERRKPGRLAANPAGQTEGPRIPGSGSIRGGEPRGRRFESGPGYHSLPLLFEKITSRLSNKRENFDKVRIAI